MIIGKFNAMIFHRGFRCILAKRIFMKLKTLKANEVYFFVLSVHHSIHIHACIHVLILMVNGWKPVLCHAQTYASHPFCLKSKFLSPLAIVIATAIDSIPDAVALIYRIFLPNNLNSS